MEKGKSSLTSLMSCFARAYHAEKSGEPIFYDYLARKLLSDGEYSALKGYIAGAAAFFEPEKSFESPDKAVEYIVENHLAPTPLARAKFCEDALAVAVRTGAEQYVILGAGLDTFAFRHPEFLKKHKIFEVDHPATQENKLARIACAGWKFPKNLAFVPVDFAKDGLRAALEGAGFDKNKKTFFSWLGVTYYLSKEDISRTLGEIACLSAVGSSLVFDYADENLFVSDIKRVRNMLDMARAGGEEIKSSFGILHLTKLLEERGFLIYELMQREDIDDTYFAPRQSQVTAFEHINYVNAAFKGL
ncbi:MAG: class I SAM-dependent methyltransferase [Candidatus Coproplasma sp.]